MFTEFSDYFASLGKTPRTTVEYIKEARYFADFLRRQGADLTDEELLILANKTDAYDYLVECTRKETSAATRARKVSSLRSFYRFLVQSEYVASNPFETIYRPKVPRRLPVFLSLTDAKHLIQTARQKKDIFYRRRDTCIVVWFLNTGLRLSELASLDMSSVYDDALRIIGKGDKERFMPLNKSCLRSLRLWLAHRGRDHGALFISKQGSRLKGSSIGQIVKSQIRAAGLDDKISTHKLRHTAATLLYRYGQVDIRLLQALLGHASIATTEIYTHVVDEQLVRAMDAHPLANF